MENNIELHLKDKLTDDELKNINLLVMECFKDTPPIAMNTLTLDILNKSFSFEKKTILFYEKKSLVGGIFFSIVNNKFVSLPHFSCSELFYQKGYKDILYKKIFNYLTSNNLDYEIRSFDKLSKYYSDQKVISYLELQDTVDNQMGFFKSKLRSQIKKGSKNNLTIEISGLSYLDKFYKIYSKNMHRLGSPVLSKVFFKNILEAYDNNAYVFIVNYNNIVIGGSIVLSNGKLNEVCWASTSSEYNYLSTNMFLYWEMIKHAVNNNMKIFSFGRSTKDSSTLKFKKQWGVEQKQLYWNVKNEPTIEIKKMTYLQELWKYIPLSIANFIGPIVSKRIY